jgi:tRNA threonylcarbamoyl adenosine modification protein YeaZ
VEKRLVLGIDTSSMSLNLAAVAESGLPISSFQEISKNHAGRFPVVLDEVLAKSGLKIEHVKAVGVVAGPGSFTGLRVGLSVALAMRSALGIPVYQVPTLLALAGFSDKDGNGASLIDARRGEFYFQSFNRSGPVLKPVSEPFPLKYSFLNDALKGLDWALASCPRESIVDAPGNLAFADNPNLAIKAAGEALRRMSAGEKGTDNISPLYVREPDAVPSPNYLPEN